MLMLEAQAPPIQADSEGVFRIGNSRVRLDSVIYAFNEGSTAEEIISQFPVLKLADVYAVIAYYLNNRVEVDMYLQKQAEEAHVLRQKIEANPENKVFREKLLARRQRLLHRED